MQSDKFWIKRTVTNEAGNLRSYLGRRSEPLALARKLLSAVWALLRHDVCFGEEVFAAR